MISQLSIAMVSLMLQMQSIALPQLHKVGEAQMQVMFWKVYRAELFAAALPYQRDSYPQLLSLTYLRDISQQALLDATQQQWQHLGISSEQQRGWLSQLAGLWPDVTKGDQLQLLVDVEQRSHFFSRNQHLGSIRDPAFGSAFLDIWLSEQTSRPRLRAQLIGVSP